MKKQSFRLVSIIIGMMSVLLLTNCNIATAKEKKLVFGLIPAALSDEWNGYSVENFKYAAAKKGVEVKVLDPAWDGTKALNNLEDLITMGVDQIGVFVLTPEEAQKFLTIANKAGIPISFENTKLGEGIKGDYIVDVYDDYFEVGYLAFKYISENYPGKKVFYVRGLPGMGIVEEFMLGIDKAVKEFGTVKIDIMRDTQWDTATAQAVVSDVIASGEKFDVIFANNESMSVGVYNALKDAGLDGKIPIVTYNGGPTGKTMLEKGIIQATIGCPVSLQGLYLFKAMYLNATKGIRPPKKHIETPNNVITLNNIDEIIPWAASDELIERIGGLDKW
jgi:ABC-type sugar transport system substrate-binding protein